MIFLWVFIGSLLVIGLVIAGFFAYKWHKSKPEKALLYCTEFSCKRNLSCEYALNYNVKDTFAGIIKVKKIKVPVIQVENDTCHRFKDVDK